MAYKALLKDVFFRKKLSEFEDKEKNRRTCFFLLTLI